MARSKTLVIVLAGGEGGRLGALTEERAKPSVRFAGMYRLIDFPLSNCVNSGLSDVWVAQQYNPTSLTEHLANGRPWDLDRTSGGLLTLPPYLGDDREGFAEGTADVLWRNAGLIREFEPDALVVLSADAVYKLDYTDVVRRHRDVGATVTMVTTQVEKDDADRYGVVQTDGGRVTAYDYKPDEPESDLVANEVFVFEPTPTLELLDEIARSKQWAGGDRDLGHQLLPRMVDDGQAWAFHFEDYWRDVGTLEAYWTSHMELVRPDPPINVMDPGWPILTATPRRGPAHVTDRATVSRSLLGPGSRIEGVLEESVLSPGVVVEPGATVRRSVLLDGTVVRSGTTIEDSIVDDGEVVWTVGDDPEGND